MSPADKPKPSPPDEVRTPPLRFPAEHESPLLAGQEVKTELRFDAICPEELRSAQQADPTLEVRERVDTVNSLYFWGSCSRERLL